MPSVAVVGAGIAGLTAAHFLHEAGWTVHVFEKTAQPGGVIRSERRDSFLVEHGPNTVRSSPLLDQLIDQLKLTGQRLSPSEAARRRYVVRDGQMVPLPDSTWAAIKTPLLSARGKLRMLAEPFQPVADAADESISSFVQRRLGPEVLQYAVDPFVAGVFAGNPKELSVRHTFPHLWKMEQDHGSLLVGALRNRSSSGEASRTIFSFREGLEVLPRALAQSIGNQIHYETPVRAVRRRDDGWQVTHDGDAPDAFDAAIYAAPLHGLEEINLDTPMNLAPFHGVKHPPLTTLALGFRRGDVGHPLDGFGVLVPSAEDDFHMLGSVFSSTLFPDRAPDGCVLLTVFLGGARHPECCAGTTEALVRLARADLARLVDVQAAPAFTHRTDWSHAVPQYTLGYERVKQRLHSLEERHPRLAWAGNYRNGISVGDAAASGQRAAQRILKRL